MSLGHSFSDIRGPEILVHLQPSAPTNALFALGRQEGHKEHTESLVSLLNKRSPRDLTANSLSASLRERSTKREAAKGLIILQVHDENRI